ncbi:hypothetical protein TW74_12230 [Vibrio nigripulchritudo]|nr:hypothetical protein TW74_12230 [Vibrio nigripulchritudo]
MMKKYLLPTLLCASISSAMAGEWDYPSNAATVTSDGEALNYVSQRYADVGSFRLRYVTESKLGKHYNFDVLVGGEYKHQRAVVLSVDNDQRVTRIFKSLEDTVVRNGLVITAVELENPRRLEALEPPELATGSIKSVNVNVFDPDLRTMDKVPQPDTLWKNLEDYPHSIRYVSKPVSVLESGGKLYLANERVRQVDAKELQQKNADTGAWETSPTSSFLAQEGVAEFASEAALSSVTYDMPEFAQIMAFYHLDHSLQYLSSLGSDLFSEPVSFDGRGLSQDNSAYYFGPKAAMFGITGSPDAIDADVVIHELGHGIHYQIVPDWGYGHTGAIGEGFGDYWAGSYSYRVQYAQSESFELDTFANWDGLFGFKKNTRSLWNQRARYFERSEYRPHEYVGGELGDELWSTPLFQSLKQSVAKYGQVAFSEFDTIVLQSMYGLGRGMKMHDLAESMIFVANKLYSDKEYVQILKANFDIHGLIKAPFRVVNTPKFIDPEHGIDLQIQRTLSLSSIDGVARTDLAKEVGFSDASSAVQKIHISGLANGVCAKPFDLALDIQYQVTSNQSARRWQHAEQLVYGQPNFVTPVTSVNAPIPDADQNNNLGVKSFSYDVYAQKNISDNLGVYFELEHEKLTDIELKLTSPDNVVIRIKPHEYSSGNTFKRYFAAGNSKELDALKGTSMYGIWRLEITDFAHQDTGALLKWGVSELSGYQCENTTTDNNKKPSTTQSSGGASIAWLSLLILFTGAWLRNRKYY